VFLWRSWERKTLSLLKFCFQRGDVVLGFSYSWLPESQRAINNNGQNEHVRRCDTLTDGTTLLLTHFGC
jgi:hypothetical protein